VAREENAVGPDIYGGHNTTRDVLVLASSLQHGDSGGALVDTSGQVVGVAFAIAADQAGTSYALSTSELKEALAEPRADPASTQGCLTSG
jgi:S1-C subfamily serine protease